MIANQSVPLEISGDHALFQGKLQGLVALCYENERPPQGLAGLLDWHFQGIISHYIQIGAISGKVGECIYIPITRHNRTYHLFLAGAGTSSPKGARNSVPIETLKNLKKNLTSLQLQQIGVSKTDFGDVTSDFFSKHMKGISLWITP